MRIGKVLNKKHGAPADAEYIGRGSMWGNKFVIGKDGTRDDVCEKHDRDLAQDDRRLRALDTLAGKDVLCFCAPLRCHGNTIVRLAAMNYEQRLEWARGVLARKDGAATPAAGDVRSRLLGR